MVQRLCAMSTVPMFLICFFCSQAQAEEKMFKGLTEKEFGKVFNQLSEKWHPTKVKGYARGNESLYDITWESGNPGYYLYVGVSAAQLAKFKQQHAKEDYFVTVENTWKVEGAEVYAAIFRRKE